MRELEGIKDFIEANKESLEKMNQEMIASYGHVPLVWLTLDEAKRVQSALYELLRNSNDKNSREWLTYWMINGRVKQVEATKICNDYNKALNRVADEFQNQEEIIRLKCEIEQLKAEQEVDNWLKKTGF